VKPNLARLAAAFGASRMDALLCWRRQRPASAIAGGDFSMAATAGSRAGECEVVPFVYAGAAILTPAFFAGAPKRILHVALVRPAAEAGGSAACASKGCGCMSAPRGGSTPPKSDSRHRV